MSEKELHNLVIKYLEKSEPPDWHQVAWNWNWDNRIEPLRWIIENPKCDKGTALLIYWYGNPGWYTKYDNKDQVSVYEMDNYLLVKDIEEKYLSGYYKNENIYFDPKDDEGDDWTRDIQEEALTKIPSEMTKPVNGEKLEKIGLIEGLPQEITDKLGIR